MKGLREVENLPGDYRETTNQLWSKYNLRPETGQLDRMRGGKKDLSMLFVYASVDNYFIDGGKLGFVITQTVFKTVGAGDGFRRFRYLLDKSTDIYIAPVLTIDLTDLQPFDDATNRSAVFICRKTHKSFSYLVPYWVWTTNVRTLVEHLVD